MPDTRDSSKKVERPYQMALRAEGIKRLEELRAKTGMSAVNINERLFEWFTSMPLKFALGILQKEGAERDELLIAWFKETMAAHGKSVEVSEGDDIAAQLRLIRQLADQIEIQYAGVRRVARDHLAEQSKGKRKGRGE